MLTRIGLALVGLYILWAAGWIIDAGRVRGTELLNVSYDPTRELWRDLNKGFRNHYQHETGAPLIIHQSHGGSSSQARAVMDGLAADVVTLALWSDTDAISRKGLIDKNWQKRLPNDSLPYYSTLVFVVRKGNPKGIRDWPDLLKPGVEVITPNPKTSGNGKLSFLAAWGAVLQKPGATEADARAYVTELYKHVPVLATGARGATTTFAQEMIGDVHLTWENEGHLEVTEAHGELELIYPSVSIRAEPFVAWVDANIDRRGTRAAAEAYLKYLYTDEAQETIAKHWYRPINKAIRDRHVDELPELKLFEVTVTARDWDDAQKKFFGDGAVFDQIFIPKKRN